MTVEAPRLSEQLAEKTEENALERVVEEPIELSVEVPRSSERLGETTGETALETVVELPAEMNRGTPRPSEPLAEKTEEIALETTSVEAPRLSETNTEASRPSEVSIEVPKFQAAPAPNSQPSLFLIPPPAESRESIARLEARPALQPPAKLTSVPVSVPSRPVPTLNRVKSPERPSQKPMEKSRATSTAPRKSEPISKKAGIKPNSPKATYAPKAIPKTRR
jgi:hypothetical protein